jgi:arabinofuranan 3-O-arabinosyltransferase
MRAEVTNDAAPGSSRARHTARRFRHLTICIALTALAFQQAPGLVVPDTKISASRRGWSSGFGGR